MQDKKIPSHNSIKHGNNKLFRQRIISQTTLYFVKVKDNVEHALSSDDHLASDLFSHDPIRMGSDRDYDWPMAINR